MNKKLIAIMVPALITALLIGACAGKRDESVDKEVTGNQENVSDSDKEENKNNTSDDKEEDKNNFSDNKEEDKNNSSNDKEEDKNNSSNDKEEDKNKPSNDEEDKKEESSSGTGGGIFDEEDFEDSESSDDKQNTGANGNTGSNNKPNQNTGSNNNGTLSKDMDYETYNALSGTEQLKFYESFETVEAFFAWYNKAKEEYDKKNPAIEVGKDTVVDLGQLAGKN